MIKFGTMDEPIFEERVAGTDVQNKFDLQARSHIIIVLKNDPRRSDSGRSCRAKRNALDNLPRPVCCAILEAAFRFVDAAFNAEFLRAPR